MARPGGGKQVEEVIKENAQQQGAAAAVCGRSTHSAEAVVPSIPVQAAGSWAGASAAWTAIPGTTSPAEARPGPPAGHTHPGGLLAAQLLGVLEHVARLGPPPLQGAEVEAPARPPTQLRARPANARARGASPLFHFEPQRLLPAGVHCAARAAAVCHDSQPALCRRRGLLRRRSRGASRRRSRASADVNASRDPLRAPASGNGGAAGGALPLQQKCGRVHLPACVRARPPFTCAAATGGATGGVVPQWTPHLPHGGGICCGKTTHICRLPLLN